MDGRASETGSAGGGGAACCLALSPLFQGLVRWWDGKRGGRDVPDRRHIDAIELGPKLLPHLILADLVGEDDCRYRVVGSEVVRWLGFDPTGRFMREAFEGAYADYIESLLRCVWTQRRPVWSSGLVRRAGGQEAETQRLLVPFTRGGAAIEVVLGIQSFRFPGTGRIPPRLEVCRGEPIEETGRHVLEQAG